MNNWFENIFWSIITLIISAPISLWLTSMSPMWIRVKVIKFLKPISRLKKSEFDIAGLWNADYVKGDDLCNSETSVKGHHLFMIYQFGNNIVGEAKTDGSHAIIWGELKKYDVFDGIYCDPRSGIEYHGTFQVIYNTNEKDIMEGKWIGFDTDTKKDINNGVWKWRRVTDKPL